MNNPSTQTHAEVRAAKGPSDIAPRMQSAAGECRTQSAAGRKADSYAYLRAQQCSFLYPRVVDISRPELCANDAERDSRPGADKHAAEQCSSRLASILHLAWLVRLLALRCSHEHEQQCNQARSAVSPGHFSSFDSADLVPPSKLSEGRLDDGRSGRFAGPQADR
jgi:hypothetical protein